MNDIIFKSRIDTLETKEPFENRSCDIFDIKGTESRYTKDMSVVTKYNPNNYDYAYSNEYKLSKSIYDFSQMQTRLRVVDPSEVSMRRIDIATDISKDFDCISKFLDLVHKCMRAKEKEGKAWSNIDEIDLNASNYIYRNRFKLEIEFYNKEKESNGKANYPTRMEIRFLRISSKDFKLHIKNAIALWKSMPLHLEYIEVQTINVLLKKWLEEKKLNNRLALSTFVYKYSNYIYTQNILKTLYKRVGLKGSFSSWLQEYRKRYFIEFYTKANLSKFSDKVIKSLKDYEKN